MPKWWKENKLFFLNERELILKRYPSLIYSIEDGAVKLSGELYLAQIDDSYSIEIQFPSNYPKTSPIVKEVGGDIPRELDLHISFDGSCCLCLPQLENFYFPEGSNIIIFLEKLVIPFFANQAYFKITGKWLNGEYDHGLLGIYEFYTEIFQTKDINFIIIFMILSLKEIQNIKQNCPCLSGKNLRICHMKNINKLKKYTTVEQLYKDIQDLKRMQLKK